MRSSLQTRRRSLLPVLALLGAAGTAATLSLAPRAAAIGGGVAPASQSTSPRETTGATPSVNLFQTSASSYSGGGGGGGGNTGGSEVTASGRINGGGGSEEREPARRRRSTTATGEREEGGASAGRKRTARRREREEGSSGRVAASGGKNAVESKDKNPIVIPPKDRPVFTIGGGWQSRYIYHGLDIVSFNSLPEVNYRKVVDGNGNTFLLPVSTRPQSSSIGFTNLGVEFKGFRLKLDYVQAVDSTVPFLQGVRGTSSLSGNDLFQRRVYRELDPGLSYTVGIASLFDVTLGYTAFLFPNDDYKGTHFNGETLVRIVYKQLKYVRPSFSYFHYNSPFDDANIGDLNGNFVEFRLDGSIPLLNRPQFGIALEPYASGSYNINYLRYSTQNVGGWNTFETGLKVPVRLGGHVAVTPFGNYGASLTARDTNTINSFNGRTNSERTTFWGGVNVSYTF